MDDGIDRPWYLWATIRRLAGLPYDFDEIRRVRLESQSRPVRNPLPRRNLIGFYLIQVGSRQTPRGSRLPRLRCTSRTKPASALEKHYVMEAA